MTASEQAAGSASGSASGSAQVLAALGEFAKIARLAGREDLLNRANAAAARLKRPSTIVCVVGEFKQGKSSLVNGLLGTDVCPVDDDLATSAITLVRHGDEPGAVVRRREGEAAVADQIPIADLGNWVSEIGNPRNAKNVERVEISVPSAILRQGLVIVDTPGMGGLGAGHAAATLSFLPFADGLVFVSDASAELSAPEIDFLRQATDLCPTVLCAQTKIDLYPHWQKIVKLNEGHFANAGIEVPIVGVSSSLRAEAMRRKDRELNDRSAFPALVQSLADDVIKPAKQSAAERSATDVRGMIGLIRSGLASEREMLADPSRLGQAIADLEAAKVRLEHLRGPGARWNVLVGDRVADLSNGVMHRFRGGMRSITRSTEERVEVLKKGDEWDEVTRDIQTGVAEQVTEAFVSLEEGRRAIRAEVAELLQEEQLAVSTGNAGDGPVLDVTELWRDKSIDEEGSAAKRRFLTGLTGARGAQSGVLMFGMMGNFLPTGVATLLAANPVLLGAGAVMGGVQLLEDRKRKVALRRQNARQFIRQFVDDVQFEVGNEITGLVRDIQRDLRDEFTDRLGELQRTYTETAKQAQQSAQNTQEETKARLAQVNETLESLALVEQAVGVPSARAQ